MDKTFKKPNESQTCPPGISDEVWLTLNVLKNAGRLPQGMEILNDIEGLYQQIEKTKNPLTKAQLLSDLSVLQIEARKRLEAISTESKARF